MRHLLFPAFSLLLALSVLAACGRSPVDGAPVGGAADPMLPEPDAVAGTSLVWQARLPCADCQGIDTVLRLYPGSQPRYELLEAYLDGNRGEPYTEVGTWERQGVMLRLRADDGAQRVYAIEPDGRLSPRDGRGRRIDRGDGRFLVPVMP